MPLDAFAPQLPKTMDGMRKLNSQLRQQQRTDEVVLGRMRKRLAVKNRCLNIAVDALLLAVPSNPAIATIRQELEQLQIELNTENNPVSPIYKEIILGSGTS